MRTQGAVVGRRFRSVTKLTTKVRIGRGYLLGSFLIAAAALKTPTRNGYNAQGVNLKFAWGPFSVDSLPLRRRSDRRDQLAREGYASFQLFIHMNGTDHGRRCGLLRGTRPRVSRPGLTPTLSDQLPVRVCVCALCILAVYECIYIYT